VRARDELELRVRERTAELSRANRELARSNADLEEFAYSASHDLQEPIRNIALSAQLLRRSHGPALDPEATGLLETVIGSARNMELLLRDLLEYARLASETDEGPALADAEAELDTVLQSLEASLLGLGAEVTRDPLPRVRLPAARLRQVLQNLIGNALKYRVEWPPRIHIGARPEGDGWRFEVRDNGIGIDPRHQEYIFGLFKRLHGRDAYPGSGVGLPICKRIVEQAGGRIWVEPAPERGSCFFFTLPGE